MKPGLLIDEQYLVERELGRGGMATVWLARDQRHHRTVAIKVLYPELAGAIGVDRFLREIRLTAQLQHPHLVPILDSGVVPGPDGKPLPWYAMPYLEGESLRARLDREGQLPIDEALLITEAVGEVLRVAHRAGVVHRDIKPENVILSGGAVYVLDFGIAKALLDTGGERLTGTGLAIGTPAYMSPEQAIAGSVDARSDQYSLATMLYEMLAGEPPFSGPSAQAVVARRLAEPARPLRAVRSSVSESLERTLLRALERAPADRFPDVAAFLTALRMPDHAVPPVRHVPRWVPRAIMVAGAVVAVTLGAWLAGGRPGIQARRPPDSEVVALYQRGMQAYERRTPAGIVEAIAALNGAIARDSGYAPAWSALAKSYVRALGRSFRVPGIPADSLLRLAVTATDRALLLDSSNADGWNTRAQVTTRLDPTDLAPALRSIRRSIRLDSTKPEAWHHLAITLYDSGDTEAGLAAWRRAVTVGPLYSQGLAFLALAHYWRRAYDSAAVWADSAVSIDPSYLLARTTAGYVAVERGEYARAEAAFEAAQRLSTDVEVVNALAGEALAKARAGNDVAARMVLRQGDSLAAGYVPTDRHSAVYLAQAYAALGQPERALDWLARYEPRGDLHFQMHLRCDPPLLPLHGNPRFRAMLIRPLPPPGQGC